VELEELALPPLPHPIDESDATKRIAARFVRLLKRNIPICSLRSEALYQRVLVIIVTARQQELPVQFRFVIS
jgi:hypothetical protein